LSFQNYCKRLVDDNWTKVTRWHSPVDTVFDSKAAVMLITYEHALSMPMLAVERCREALADTADLPFYTISARF
jgi:hypothetical protein